MIKSPSAARQEPTGMGQDIVFTTEDNLVIAGSYYPPGRKDEPAPMVILVHMYKTDRSDFGPLLPTLRKAGFAVLAIDLRGHGQSAGPTAMKLAERVAQRDKELFSQMHQDVAAAYLWLRGQPNVDPARFALVGASVGGSIALDYASRDKSVDAVVGMTPGTAYLGLDAVGAVRKYGNRPLLLLASEEERSAADQLRQAAADATIKIVHGPSAPSDSMALHGARMFGKVTGVESEIASFLVKAVGPASRDRVVASIKGKVYYDPDSGPARNLSPQNVRWFSSPAEAEARGFRPPAASSRSRSKRGGDEGAAPRSRADRFPDGK
jgi:dienelactone hydrolase